MVTHRRTLLICVACVFALVAACDKVPLLAPTGSAISLFLSTNSASLNSEVTIIATVIENGQDAGGSGTGTGTRGAGTPVQNGTVITFTTTIGTIEPAEARTHNGQVSVKLITGSSSGSAVITAYSGGASKQGTLKIGTAAVTKVSVTSNPQSLGSSGGTAQVVATATDDGGTGVGGVPVTFTTDKGSLSPSTVSTDSSGIAATTLTTTATAKVGAKVSTLAAVETTVTVTARSLASFIASTPATTTGVPVGFTVTPNAGTNISNVHVEFGDGRSQDTGPISSTNAVSVPHSYTSSGVYTATASANGEPSLTATVSIGQIPISLTATPSPGSVNSPITFAAEGIPANVQVDRYEWAFDDGTTQAPTSGPRITHIFNTVGIKTARVDVFAVGGGKLGTATVSVRIQ